MSSQLKKPYEISIWEDILVNEDNKSYYKEVKIATIGSDLMTAPEKVFDPIFTQNVNGEITLTFQIAHKYYDDLQQNFVVNPFIKYLINERKVKLFYDNEWYDFIIKTCEETSDSNIFSYTAKGLFVNELGKVGYNIVLSNDLRNNQGTIFELGEKAVKGTDWIIDKENSDIIQQFVAEPLYRYVTDADITVKNLQTSEEVVVEANEVLFIFYSTIANKQTENVFFLRESDYDEEKTLIDDNNVARLPNYSFLNEISFNKENPTQIDVDGAHLTREITEDNSTGINYNYQGYRLAYNQQVGYDTIKDRPVTLYEAEYENGSKETIYKYTDYEYVTSDVVTNFMTNGSGFNIYQDGSLEGWSTATPNEKVQFSRGLSDLVIGDNLGVKCELKNIREILADLRINTTPFVVDTTVSNTFTYTITTDNGSAQLAYTWNSIATNDSLVITVSITGQTAITKTYTNSSPLTSDIIIFSNAGIIQSISVTPNASQLKTVFENSCYTNLVFTTTQSDGKYILPPLELTTYPKITANSILDLTQLSELKGYLRTQFRDVSGKSSGYSNSIYNSGIGDCRDQIGSFSKGESYVFRIAYGLTDEDGGRPQLTEGQEGKIKAVVAKYTTEPLTVYNQAERKEELIYLYTPDVKNILFEFNGPFELQNNIITGGYFGIDDQGNYTTYYKDGVSIAPSVDYIYKEEVEGGVAIEKIWNQSTSSFIDQNDKFINYYLTTAICQKSISNTVLADTADDYGIFLYIDDSNFISTDEHPNYFLIKEVQLFKEKRDKDNNIVLIGNIPQSTAISTDFYYLQPTEDTEEESIETYSSIDAIAASLGLTANEIKPVYNENFEKISSIEASQSNCFNIIQDLCEAFECWAKFNIQHNENGAIRLDSDGMPQKTITFHNYCGKDNFAGFKYGINLESIQRTIESDEFVSKLIVEQVANDVVEGGTVSIAAAPSNPSGESYILNMSYYLNHGLIENPQQYYVDYNNFIEQLKNINNQYTLNKTKLQLATTARAKSNSNVNVYYELVEEAKKSYTEALFDFKDLTGINYEDYTSRNGYTISFSLVNNEFYGVYSTFVSGITPSFFDGQGNMLVLEEHSRQESGDKVTIKYEIISTGDVTQTFNDIAYIGIIDDIDGFEITNADTSYLDYINSTIPVTAALLTNLTKYIWEFNTANNSSKNRTITIIPSSDHEALTDIVGKIYTYQQVIKDYSPLLDMSKSEKTDLDLLINGTKNYNLTISTVSNVEFNTTKEILDDYTEGLSFTLENSNGSWDINTTITEKAYSQDNLYTVVRFKKYPRNYQLKYTANGETYITSKPIGVTIPTNGTKVFTLIPIEEQKGIKDIMQELLDEKDLINEQFYKKYSRYIQEGSWTSSDYIDNELYYLDALNVAATNAKPQVNYDLSVYEISEQPGFENYTFGIGDKTYIEDTQFFGYHVDIIQSTQLFDVDSKQIRLPENAVNVYAVYYDLDHYRHFQYDFKQNIITILDDIEDDKLYVRYSWRILTPIREEVIVSEAEWHLDNTSENSITIQNYRTQFDDLFQRMAAAVQSVEYNTPSYSRAASILDESGFINSGLLLKSLNELTAGVALSGDGTITTTEDGIVIKDLLDPLRQMKLAGGGLKTSLDGGYNWDTVITAEGLTIDTIDTQNVLIKDGDNPSFRWDKYGLNAYGFNSVETDLKTYVRYDKYGLYGVLNGENFQAKSLQDIKDVAQFGLLWDGFFIKNSYTDGYVSISSDNDFQVVANDQERIKIGALEKTQDGYEYGIRIKNAVGEDVFTTDDAGDIEISGIINAKGGAFTNQVSVGAGSDSIILQGSDEDAIIGSSSYFSDSMKGWAIKSDGDAIFNNITARGAIKTAVFEYSEIEAVGGIFIFRPSSTIRTATIPQRTVNTYVKVIPEGESSEGCEIDPNTDYFINTGDRIGTATINSAEVGDRYTLVDEPKTSEIDLYYVYGDGATEYSDDLLLTVENPLLFKIGDWCKVSNYTPEDPNTSLADNGLVNIFEIVNIYDNILVLANGAKMFSEIINPTVIDDDYIEGIGYDNVYNLTDVTDQLHPHAMENLTEKYYYGIITLEDNESESEVESEEVNDVIFGEGVPQTTTFANSNGEYQVTFIGNLSLWSQEEEHNTGENYLLITITLSNQIPTTQTLLFVGEGNDYFDPQGINRNINLLIQKKFELSYEVNSLVGGALVSFGNYETHALLPTLKNNYGIGINSSDSAVNLPARAITLFETEIYPQRSIKVGYNYRGVLGTLPRLGTEKTSAIYNDNMVGTQGIYTDNMYIGDNTHYLAFYTDKSNNKKTLRLNGADIWFTYIDEHGEPYEESIEQRFDEIEGGEGILLTIESSEGTVFDSSNIQTVLTAHVYKEGVELPEDSENEEQESIHGLGLQVNWYTYGGALVGGTYVNDINAALVGVTETLLLEDSMTYNVNAIDEIEIIAKLEEIPDEGES